MVCVNVCMCAAAAAANNFLMSPLRDEWRNIVIMFWINITLLFLAKQQAKTNINTTQ